MLIIRPSFWSSYGKILAEPHYEANDNQILSHASKSSFSASVLVLIIKANFLSSYGEICTEPHRGPKHGQFETHCHRPLIHRFPLLSLCVSCKQHFGVLTVKFVLKEITTHKMAGLENIVTRLRIIVLCYHQNNTLELLP